LKTRKKTDEQHKLHKHSKYTFWNPEFFCLETVIEMNHHPSN